MKKYIIKDLYEFKKNNSQFFNMILFLVDKYKDDYYKYYSFTRRYRDLFRILSKRERIPEIATPEEYQEMREDAHALERYDNDAFQEFSRIIRRNVDMQGLGYNKFINYILEVADLVPCDINPSINICENCSRYINGCDGFISEKERDYLFIKYNPEPTP